MQTSAYSVIVNQLDGKKRRVCSNQLIQVKRNQFIGRICLQEIMSGLKQRL
jgi:hypothetical protein